MTNLTYLFSQSASGFYIREIHGDSVPSDAVEITESQYVSLLNGQSAGQVITAGADGYPQLVSQSAITAEIPQSVTRRQALLALLEADLLDDVEAIIASAPRAVQIAWEASSVFQRDNALIAGIAPQLSLSESDVDALFVRAAAL